ncbi:hypothetical protein [Bacteroides sp.]|uniref:hypothetical protein n=1 Tax=Bacteroides sp. TaxID=29523 RepID=UPI002583AC61|nr:hypothetical protein [Bacteroides sp.]
MEIAEFETFVETARKDFRELIAIYLDGEVGEMKRLIKDKLDECCSEFEVNALKEGLQEEFSLYLDELKGE